MHHYIGFRFRAHWSKLSCRLFICKLLFTAFLSATTFPLFIHLIGLFIHILSKVDNNETSKKLLTKIIDEEIVT